jgi:hypothetical protein
MRQITRDERNKRRVKPVRDKKTEPWASSDGYMRFYDENGKIVMYHRYVVAKFLGRELKRSETVKFKDGNKENCDLSNLVLVTDEALDLSKIQCPNCHSVLI